MNNIENDIITQNNESENKLISNYENVNELSEKSKKLNDTTCGIWFLRGKKFQKFANKKSYVILYSVVGCVISGSYAYYNGILTTIEKRFKISSKTTGCITIGTDIAEVLGSIICYYVDKGHRPRLMGVGTYLTVFFCCLSMLPHFLYGPGDDALQLTKEYNETMENDKKINGTIWKNDKEKKFLCFPEINNENHCDEENNENFTPPMILFVAQLFGGIGASLFSILGISYMDDNIEKSKAPMFISFSFFLRLLGPALGFSMASFSLKFYIDPALTPIINNEDPRWLGAWWLGWGIFVILLLLLGSIIGLFPKILPQANEKKIKNNNLPLNPMDQNKLEAVTSNSDMIQTFKRLLKNKILMFNNMSAIFYVFGYGPYWTFMPKYIETQYKQSASFASLVTGTIGLVFSAIGILLSGFVISKFQPKARYLAGWNVFISTISIIAMISFVFLGCSANDDQVTISDSLNTEFSCNHNCNCDYVTYNPVCSKDGQTFISACHAGCKNFTVNADDVKIYWNCSCSTSNTQEINNFGPVTSGPCPIDCQYEFYLFLAVVCSLNFLGSTGRASNFLVSIRCVEENDKTASMAFGMTIMGLLAFMPTPLLFGYIIDTTCLVWGKTCSGTGNCWIYDSKLMRNLLNYTSASFVIIGTLFDVGVWYYVKDLKIFDEDIEL